ncbi:MAG: hypothetical protein UH788_08590 [Treponemataceae bacterium]|nr:hypothetical protein [Treponemataceae bacterium]
MKNYFKLIFCVIFLFSFTSLMAFEWPVDISSTETTIKTNFAENRDTSFAKGFVFSTSEDIKSSEDGVVLVHLNPENSYYENFSSTLDNAVILAHQDKMLSVYSGFEQVNQDIFAGEIPVGTTLGSINKKSDAEVTEESSTTKILPLPKKDFEFQIIDTKNTVVINPFLLLSKLEKISPVFPGKIFVVNKKGTEINLEERKSFASGIYSIYRENSSSRMPLKTSVFVNGEEFSTISYDTLLYKNSRICVSGKDFFPIEKIYPNSKRQFLGDIEVSRGKNLITVVVTDSLGIERRISHTIEAW